MMLKIRVKNNNGFSLVEMMVATLIFTFLMGALHLTLLSGRRSWDRNSSMLTSQQSVRNAVNQMSKDLRIAESITVSQSSGTASVTFSIDDIGNVSYAWANTGLNANRVIRTLPSGSKVIANNITSFSVTDATDDVTVALTATTTAPNGGSVPFSSTKKIAKRL